MRRRMITILVALVLLVSSCGVTKTDSETQAEGNVVSKEGNENNAAEKEISTEEAVKETVDQEVEVGQTIRNFVVESVTPMPELSGNMVMFRHEPSKAKLVWIQNPDQNRAFNISFRSYPTSNNGASHVLEHSVLTASRKYPSQNFFNDMEANIYNTYVNASTYSTFITYPGASGSDEQLLKMEDVYFSLLFDGFLKEDNKTFLREGWHYELENKDAPLTINGITYNEISQREQNIIGFAQMNMKKLLWPDTMAQYTIGGHTEEIPTLSYEELLEEYNQVYSADNCIVGLYGDVELEAHLDQIDGYLRANFRNTGGISKPADQTLFEKPVEKVVSFPDSQQADVENGSLISYNFSLPSMDIQESTCMEFIAAALGDSDQPLMRALQESQIAQDYSVAYYAYELQPVLIFEAKNAKADKGAEFKRIIDEQLNAVCSNGLDQKLAESYLKSKYMEIALTSEQSFLGVRMLTGIANDYFTYDDCLITASKEKYLDGLKEALEKGEAEKLVEKHFLKNNNNILLTTVPEPGGLEKKLDEQKNKLAATKAAMSDAEINAIIEQNKVLNEWMETESVGKKEAINAVAVVKPSDLPGTVKPYDITDTTKDGVRYLTIPTQQQDKLFDTGIHLDLSGISDIEELYALKLYAMLAGKLNTQTMSSQEVKSAISANLSDFTVDLNPINTNYKTGTAYPAFNINFIAMGEEYDTAISLLQEILFNSDISGNQKRITEIVNELVVETKASLQDGYGQPLHIQHVVSASSEEGLLKNAIMGMEWYNYLVKCKEGLEKDPTQIIDEIENAVKKLSAQNAVVLVSGKEDGIEDKINKLSPLLDGFGKDPIKNADIIKTLKAAPQSESIVANSPANYNVVAMSTQDMKIDASAASVMLKILDDRYLTKEIRLKNGAYGVGISSDEVNVIISSHGDPNIDKTYEVIKNSGKALADIDITQEELDRYIVNRYSVEVPFRGEMKAAKEEMLDYIAGKTTEVKNAKLEELLNLKAEDIPKFAEILEKALENPRYVTLGSKEAIDNAKTPFDRNTDIR